MAFRSGYLWVQNARIITEKKHFFLNRETNSHALQGLKKKVELPQNKQIFSSVSGSLERIKKAFLYWSCSRTFMLTSALVPIYAAGFYTSTSGGHSNFRLLTKYLQKRRPENPIPSLGKEKHSDLNLFPNHCFVLRRGYLKNRRQKCQRERARKLSHGVNMPVWRVPLVGGWTLEMREFICGAREGFHSEGACNFLLVPVEEDLVHSWIFKQIIFQIGRSYANLLQTIFLFYKPISFYPHLMD